MCGILGGNNNGWDYEKGIQALYHRGPDGQQVKYLEGFTMAFARLSIIDLSSNAMQPMTSCDGKVTIVYNGEIYGYASLKKDLEKKYEFFSHSDTEVILNAYMEYGDMFIEKIDGMFAIAIYDRRTMQLKLFRDRVGIKPLYYYFDGMNFAFSSELKAIVATCNTLDFQIDYTAIYDYLFYQYIPEPKTMYKNCFKLLPAHELIFDIQHNKIVSIGKYWKMHVNTSKGRRKKENVLCDELRALLDESVKDQLIADVPVGTFLSGGIDSSIVTYISNIYSPDIYAFTIGFENPKFDESRYARILTDRYKLNCVEKILADQDIHAINQKLKVWYDEPFADTSAYPSFIVSQLAREKVTVVLTGDGGDELFGGYTRYQIYDNWMKDKELDSQMLSDMCRRFNITDLFSNKMKKRYINTGLEIYLPVIFLADKKATENYRKQWGIDKDYDVTWYLKKYYKKELPPMTRARYMDFKTYLPSDILTKVDRVSMANSLETRVPFLSRKIIEFAFSLSEEECCTSKNLKGILKSAFNKEIPDDLLYRKKMGFSVPEEYLADKRGGIPITVGILKSEWKEIDKNVENIGRK
jgi:asparagine synthase (glutamine-hydrolysing)